MARAAKKQEGTAGLEKLVRADGDNREGFGHSIARYLEWMAIHNYSRFTIRARQHTLIRFALWCQMRALEAPRDVTKPILERYQKHLFEHRKRDERGLTFGSQAGTLSALKVFFSWLTRQNGLLWNPASEIELPRVPDRIPRAVLTITEVEAVLAGIDVESPFGLRDRAMIETLYSTGIRRSELLALRLGDLDGERGILLIREGKGGKDRMVPIGARAVHWIDAYLDKVRPDFVTGQKEDTLFLSHRGTPLNAEVVTTRIRRHVEAAKLDKSGSCHLFRHTMATLMLEGGADIRFIQQMLGHASLDTTEIYTRVAVRMLKAVHEASHPARLAPTNGGKQGAGGPEEREIARRTGTASELMASLAAEALLEDLGEQG